MRRGPRFSLTDSIIVTMYCGAHDISGVLKLAMLVVFIKVIQKTLPVSCLRELFCVQNQLYVAVIGDRNDCNLYRTLLLQNR